MKSTLIIMFLTMTLNLIAQDSIKIKTSAQCNECKIRIERKVLFSKGIISANLNISTAELLVVYEKEKTNPTIIKILISSIGYDADEIWADEKAYHNLPDCCKKGGHVK